MVLCVNGVCSVLCWQINDSSMKVRMLAAKLMVRCTVLVLFFENTVVSLLVLYYLEVVSSSLSACLHCMLPSSWDLCAAKHPVFCLSVGLRQEGVH